MEVKLQYQDSPLNFESKAEPFNDKRVIDALQLTLDGAIQEAKKLLSEAGYSNGFIAGAIFTSHPDKKILIEFSRAGVDLIEE
jgi:hypothetical protein